MIKTKLRLGAWVGLALALLLGAQAAMAADITFTGNVTVSLTNPAIDLTVVSNSDATTMTVNAGDIVVTIPVGSTFEVTSAARDLSVSGGSSDFSYALVCSATAVATMRTHVSNVVETLTITPTAAACTPPAGGGGGGGGGGEAAPAPAAPAAPTAPVTPAPAAPLGPVVIPPIPANPTVADLQAVINAMLQQIAYLRSVAPAGAVTAPPSAVPPTGSYQVPLTVGVQNDDVGALQNFLKSQGADVYPEGLVTGYFGPLTRAAVGRFQLKNGIVTSTSDPGYGYVGPRTRAKINSLLGL